MEWFRWIWNKCITDKINAEIEILKIEEKKIRHIIDCLKKSKVELLDLYKKKKRDITGYLKNRIRIQIKACKKPKKRSRKNEKELEK